MSRSLGSGLLAGGAQRTAAATKPQAVADVGRGRLVGVAGAVQRGEQPVAGAVAGEHPACAIGSMGGRRQAEHVDAGRRIAEAGSRASPVLLVAERRALLARDLLAPLHEARAAAAVDDPPLELG